jgi:hypothetical protein
MSVLDYSRGRLTAVQVRAAGHNGVVRYCGTPGNPKNITATEYVDLVSGSGGQVRPVGVALIYEGGTGDALGGFAAGVAAARAARADANRIGFPRSRPIYFAVDTDITTQMATVMDFLRGAGSVLGGPQFVGVYGEFTVTLAARAAGVARWFWQTVAWSAGVRDKLAHLYQRAGGVTVAGVGCDLSDQLQPDYGQHPPPPKEDPLSALSDQEQRDLYNRIIGFCRQRWYILKDGAPVEVSGDTPGAIPAHALDTLDGNWIITRIDDPAGSTDVGALADRLIAALGPSLAGSIADEIAARMARPVSAQV